MVTNAPSYGNCFTFNAADNSADLFAGERISSMTGPFFGLSVILNLEQRWYMNGGESKQAGARLTVHDSAVRPLVDEFGYDVMPNTLTEAAIQQLYLERQPAPYTSNCTNDWSHTNYTEYVPDGWSYTLQQCQRFCSHSSIMDTCDCFHPVFLDSDSRFGNSPCNLTSGCKYLETTRSYVLFI
jgi:hypothetical protein